MRLSSFAVFIALAACAYAVAQTATQISPRAYVEDALNYMQENALNKHSVNWQAVREQTLIQSKDAKTTWDTYPAIAYAITQLGEKHSWFQLPDNLPYDRRQAPDAEIKKILARPDPDKPSPFFPSKQIMGHMIYGSGGNFAYVVVPMCVGRFAEWEKNGPDFQEFADRLHRLVLDLQNQKPRGWIIDLRGNSGGNMWPMLAGIGAVLGEGDLGAFVSSDGEHTGWRYRAGQVCERSSEGKEDVDAEIKEPPLVLPELPWVAVLFDRGTASSGEAVAIAFAGRRHERSFGEHTAGFSTSNGTHELTDGAVLYLCNALEADRSGKLYADGLDPDEKVPTSATRPSEENDAVLKAAREWLTIETNRSH